MNIGIIESGNDDTLIEVLKEIKRLNYNMFFLVRDTNFYKQDIINLLR
ncbi:TPA: hypothetical protein P6W17_002460 [Staphylococcus aureus]|nr:hypothetical protein [Staphylococcus aureus]HDP5870956.1 hypothetical protein [Staphylococcus aureus]HDP5926347.1 hypothetical protein [Staphylococcus aureus]HDP6029207.1 hypothetical protein [Staphylococcus aureus]HDP6110156.1 hypothetical protein [Staphylococcus aureus]